MRRPSDRQIAKITGASRQTIDRDLNGSYEPPVSAETAETSHSDGSYEPPEAEDDDEPPTLMAVGEDEILKKAKDIRANKAKKNAEQRLIGTWAVQMHRPRQRKRRKPAILMVQMRHLRTRKITGAGHETISRDLGVSNETPDPEETAETSHSDGTNVPPCEDHGGRAMRQSTAT